MRHTRTTGRLLAAGALLLAAAGCGDLTLEPRSNVTSGSVWDDPDNYRAFAAKLYAGLVVTGQAGPAGDPDIGGIDEGFSQYVRGYWQLQELPTDEAIIGWGDIGLPELNTQLWSASNPFVTAMYARIFYQVALANEFLRQTSQDSLAARGVSGQLAEDVALYRAEARFLRALSYWHALDLYRNVPFVTEDFDVVNDLPTQAPPAELFDFIESELLEIRGELPAAGAGEYARADAGAVDMMLAKLYLNAEVYTGTARWADALAAAQSVIASGAYSLDPNYLRMFSADNHTSPEIIFAVPQDGLRTRTYGGTTYLAHAGVGGNNMNAAAYGLNGGWWGLRLRPETYARYEGGAGGPDGRSSYFFTEGHTTSIANIGDFMQGIAAPKYRNITSAGVPGSNAEFPDTDFPMFRLADAYLIYAEAAVRTNTNLATALGYVNEIRERAYGDATGNITAAELTLDFILDERSRELLWEGHRRQDLVRYGRFSDAGIWQWKGGIQAGQTTEPWRDLYPIPANELSANPNIEQNTGY